ncbi:hypothetical protein EXE58_03135 [Nocardioides seonyuensis]|uniref:Uncharacterized protein n=1 Tax=Nocardioides seonyuensis TaxID=2518371 RepID=A0A4P7ID97_9ACTN|nr:hypothetical protein [Nocardioides seonyuensis]QBX54563.1 hypothetical protein EXE58_03135 [Nocardioides seonyuensis]
MLELLVVTLGSIDLGALPLADGVPDDTEVKAGPLGAAVFVFLILAVVVIGFSLVRQLRKAQSAKDAGLYGDEPVERTEDPEKG